MKLIFGLGNPGAKYALNYHNLGFMVLDVLSDKIKCPINRKAKNGIYGEFNCRGEKVLLIKPQTFMNNSGECVKPFVDFFKCDLSDILVIYDDIDIDKGRLRYRPGGHSGTHNGMRNITELLGSGDFPRLRVGSKNTNPNIPLIDYVLMNIPSDEKQVFLPVLNKAADFVMDFVSGMTADELMCKYNRS